MQPAKRLRVLHVLQEQWPLRVPFTITGSTMTELDVVTVTLEQDGCIGRGEAAGVDYRGGDGIPDILAQIESLRERIESGLDRASLQRTLHAGGARNAFDCALWELDAQLAGRPVWQLAGLPPPRALLTTYTIGAAGPASMAASARAFAQARAIKLKLTGETADEDRVRDVRAARPDVWLGIDANQGFSRRHLDSLMPALVEARVALIEQPFAVGQEPELRELNSPIPIAADESAQGLADIEKLTGRFNIVNIKLDKCGGLTEALAMAATARRMGMSAMVGNMVGTSLAMAPAFVLGQLCEIADLDGPVLLRSDRTQTVDYANGAIFSGEDVWGGARAPRAP